MKSGVLQHQWPHLWSQWRQTNLMIHILPLNTFHLLKYEQNCQKQLRVTNMAIFALNKGYNPGTDLVVSCTINNNGKSVTRMCHACHIFIKVYNTFTHS